MDNEKENDSKIVVNDEELFRLVQADLKLSTTFKNEADEYMSKMRAIYNGTSYKKNKYRSNFVAREAYTQIEWLKSQLKNPFVANKAIVRLSPEGKSDRPFDEQTETLLNYMYTNKFDKYNFVTDLIDVLAVEGTAVIKTGWDYEGKTIKENTKIIDPHSEEPKVLDVVPIEREVAIVNNPTSTLCRNIDIFIDPTAHNNNNIQFIVDRSPTSYTDLVNSKIEYKNLDKLKEHINDTVSLTSGAYADAFAPGNIYNQNFDDNARKKVYMYEYWGYLDVFGTGTAEPIVITIVNNVVIRAERNPFASGKIPYIVTQCVRVPHSIYGKSIVDLIADKQNVKTGLMRAIFDDIQQSNSRQIGMLKHNLDATNMRKFLNKEPFEYNIPGGFYQGNYNRIPNEIFSLVQMMDHDIQLTSGVVPMQGGQGSQAVYGSQAGKSGQMNSLMLREADMVQNIADNAIKPMLKQWTVNIYDLMESEEIEQITEQPFIDNPNPYLSPDGSLDYYMSISTQHTDEMKASEWAFLLQTLGNNLPFEMTQMLMSEIAKLKGSNDVAAAVKEFKPQPNLFQQQQEQLELQLLQSQIQESQARIAALQGKGNLDVAKSQESQAKATSISMDTMRKKYGIDNKEKQQNDILKHKMTMDQALFNKKQS